MSNGPHPPPSLDGQLKLVEQVSEIRATRPQAIAEALQRRRRRPLLNENGVLFLVAADHPARGVLKSGTDRMAMADPAWTGCWPHLTSSRTWRCSGRSTTRWCSAP
jgi:hypothetical protein